MQNALYAEINTIGVCLLSIILFSQRQNIGSSTLQRQFTLLVYSTIAVLILDTACWLLDGTTFPHARIFNIAIETLYYFFNIYIPYLWAVYVEIALHKEQTLTYRRLRILAVPLILLSVALIINLQSDIVFTIDENNVYQRNYGFFAFAVFMYAYMGYASVRALIAAHRATWNEEKQRYYTLASFMVLPAIGGIIQSIYYGVSLIWVLVAVSIMLMYIDSINRQISADPLTGINNRRELARYLLRETKETVNKGVLALLMIDVDGFKKINDTHGHYYGDYVLVAVSEILKNSCKKTPAFLARYGGDEFCIVYPTKDIEAVEGILTVIQSNVDLWNNVNNEPVSIGLSVGYSVWQPETDNTVEDLYKRADQRMYQAKSAKKSSQSIS